ncbi:MAG TPA: hypothetical protein DDZ51_28595 [Planctomycetaceae bacterium]|nr:hypothetical protein [Planctomycetaceae bacterium]
MKPSLLICLALLFFGLIGCGPAINKSNYERIESDMTLSEVQAILGKGTEQGSSDAKFGGLSMSAKIMVWQADNQIITISFLNDKVNAKAQVGL